MIDGFVVLKEKLQWRITAEPVMSFQHHLSSAGPFELLMSEPLEANLITIISTQMEFQWLKKNNASPDTGPVQ